MIIAATTLSVVILIAIAAWWFFVKIERTPRGELDETKHMIVQEVLRLMDGSSPGFREKVNLSAKIEAVWRRAGIHWARLNVVVLSMKNISLQETELDGLQQMILERIRELIRDTPKCRMQVRFDAD